MTLVAATHYYVASIAQMRSKKAQTAARRQADACLPNAAL